MEILIFVCVGAGMFMAASILGRNKPKDIVKDTAKGCLAGIGGGFLLLLLIYLCCALILFFLFYALINA